MPITFTTAAGPLASSDDWAATTEAREWKRGRAARELARAWWPGMDPEVPQELADLLGPFLRVEEVQVLGGTRLRITARDAAGPAAVHLLAVADETFGEKIEPTLVEAARGAARDAHQDLGERILAHAAGVLAPWRDGLPHLGELRVDLLDAVARTLEFADEVGTARAIFVVHELVHLQRTRESARRRNREDLDRFVRRLTGGETERLHRGVLLGPLTTPGHGEIELFVGKIRRDLDTLTTQESR